MDEDKAVKLVLLKFAPNPKYQVKRASPRRPLPFAWTRATIAEHIARRDEWRRLEKARRTRVWIRQHGGSSH